MPFHRVPVLAAAPLACALAVAGCRTGTAAVPPAATAATVPSFVADSLRWPLAVRARLALRAERVTIRRDDLGIPHVDGATDADVVFGMMYAQAEDDFMRVERNYLVNLGRLAEAEGEGAVWSDLRARLWVDPDTLQAQYAAAPAWLRALMDAWADGLNWYLVTHPAVVPRAITRFEPWMTLAFTEGSIGGDIESVNLRGLQALYGVPAGKVARAGDTITLRAVAAHVPHDPMRDSVPGGSNGIAIAPARTASGHALLLVNPHTSHYFRSEARLRSREGLDAYGASTWGQFFVYQGFNARLGWMHTSSGNDSVDEYAEAVELNGDGTIRRPVYRYGLDTRPLVMKPVTLRVRQPDGTLATRTLATWHTHHGPITRAEGGRLIATRLMWRPVEALVQGYLRTKARTLAEFRAAIAAGANSSNNTVYADADGHIAYVHAQFVPRRDPRFDWTKPVDGSDPATEWGAVHAFDELPNVVDPARGWIQNTNNWPYSVVGEGSPREGDFPGYVDRSGENPRGIHALRVLGDRRGWTMASLREAAYSPDLPAFDALVPALAAAYDALPAADARRARLAEPMATLRAWDRRAGTASVATTVAIHWAEEAGRRAMAAGRPRPAAPNDVALAATPAMMVDALAATVDTLAARFGTWRTPWGEVNRFQRIANTIEPRFDDARPSEPVGFASARWGSLASYDARRGNATRKRYGTYGNSFVAIVEFGPRVRAAAVMAGGQSGDRTSRHFADQAATYASGQLRAVYFHDDELAGHVAESYVPGKRRR